MTRFPGTGLPIMICSGVRQCGSDGSAPGIAGKNLANPLGAILTAAMMLNHLGLTNEAEKIEVAVLEAIRQRKTTVDVGGSLGTIEAGEWVAQRVRGRVS